MSSSQFELFSRFVVFTENCSFRQNNKELRIRFSILNSEMTLPPSRHAAFAPQNGQMFMSTGVKVGGIV